MTYTKIEQAEAAAALLNMLEAIGGERPTVYVTTTKGARSGMSRRLRFFIAVSGEQPQPEIVDITWRVACVLDRTMNDDGMLSQGAGMDMHFEATYALGRKLYNDGYALRKETL